MTRKSGVLGYYTDYMSEESQAKCKPIVDKLVDIIADCFEKSYITDFEAERISFTVDGIIRHMIQENEKNTTFKKREIKL